MNKPLKRLLIAAHPQRFVVGIGFMLAK